MGGLSTLEDQVVGRTAKGRLGVSPYMLPGMLPNMAAARIAIRYGIQGYSSSIATACAAGAQSIGEAVSLEGLWAVAAGAGGFDSRLPLTYR